MILIQKFMGSILTKVKPGEFHFKQSVSYVKGVTAFITKSVASQTENECCTSRKNSLFLLLIHEEVHDLQCG